jgi:hypothetical protein
MEEGQHRHGMPRWLFGSYDVPLPLRAVWNFEVETTKCGLIPLQAIVDQVLLGLTYRGAREKLEKNPPGSLLREWL